MTAQPEPTGTQRSAAPAAPEDVLRPAEDVEAAELGPSRATFPLHGAETAGLDPGPLPGDPLAAWLRGLLARNGRAAASARWPA
jgi:hypothetical protein